MVGVVGTPPLRRIALWVAIKTKRLSITGIRFFLAKFFFGMPGAPMNNLTPMESCPEVARYVKLDPTVPVT